MKNPIRWIQVWCALMVSSALADEIIIERGPNHNVVQAVETVVSENKTNYFTNTFTQLGSGLNYFDADQNAYAPSSGAIELLETGAVYRKAQYKLTFAANINDANGNLHWYPSDDKHIIIRTIGIAITDEATGDSIWLGLAKDTQGFLTASNEVTWPSCFDQIDADVRVSVNPWGFQNDIVLHERVSNAANFQGPVRVEAWHQIISGPEPELEPGGIPRGPSKVDSDTQLNFGRMMIGSGTAFLVGTNREVVGVPGGAAIRVSKDYFIDPDSGARYLIEGIPLAAAEPQMRSLPASTHARTLDPKEKQRLEAMRRPDQKRRRPMAFFDRTPKDGRKVAAITRRFLPERGGLLLDFTSLVTTSNKILQGDTTYVVATNTVVNLSGSTVLEPGCVIKFGQYNPTNNTPIINILGTLDCQTRPYCPAVFTSREDRNVGETNTAVLASVATNAYGAYHICIPASNTNAITLHDIRSRYALNAFGFLGTNTVEAWNIQVVSSQGKVFEGAGNTITLRNVLVHKANDVAAASANNTVFQGEHFTIHSASKSFNAGSYTGCSLNLTNSLVVVVTNSSSSGFSNTSGAILSDDTGVFQTVGSAAHYLADNSPYRNAGTTGISTNLSAGVFRYSTTYPPMILSAAIKVPVTLTPQAQRDLDIPDQGYHYPSLDWALSGITATADIVLTNGVALACYGTAGLTLSGGNFFSEGRPLNLNRIVRYNTVQEQPTDWGSMGGTMRLIDTSSAPINLRLTEFSHLANSIFRVYTFYGGLALPSTFAMRDCETWSSYLTFSMGPDSLKAFGLTNNLFHRCTVQFDQGLNPDDGSGYPLSLSVRENHYRYGSLYINYYDTLYYWEAYDNLFDNVTISQSGAQGIYNSYNGYINTTTLPGGSFNKTVTTADYQIGVQGRFYYPTSGSGLFTLVNAGSQTAASAGMYHYTVRTDDAKDTSTVDIGRHVVALDSNGLPYDTDGDGIPDYLEDRNGNGTVDSGETSWTASNGVGSGAAALIVFTPLQ